MHNYDVRVILECMAVSGWSVSPEGKLLFVFSIFPYVCFTGIRQMTWPHLPLAMNEIMVMILTIFWNYLNYLI